MLPVINEDSLRFSEDETLLYSLIKKETELTRAELDDMTGFDKSKTLRITNSLIEKGVVRRLGKGPGVTYRLS